ncbi:MAG: cytochrome-c peroxidase, partial [Bacteroidota bacterium]
GDAQITEDRMQRALAQFIRSFQSFDSKYDEGRAQVNNDNTNFPNFTAEENTGKNLFSAPPNFNGAGVRVGGGLGCAGCHQAPEFSIDPRSDNNGVIGVLGGGGQDLTVTRSPSLRDVFLPNGQDNGPFMHTGTFATINEVLSHYNRIPQGNPELDRRLSPGGNPQQLNMTQAEREALIAFLRTLTGSNLYTDERWSDPF